MKYFALGSLCVLVFLMLAGCSPKKGAVPKPSPSLSGQSSYVPKDPATKRVFDWYVKSHRFRSVKNIEIGEMVKRPAEGEYAADSVQMYRVTSFSNTKPSDTKVEQVPYDPNMKKLAIRHLPKNK